jgi:DNA-binding transcriptional regulator WhiA
MDKWSLKSAEVVHLRLYNSEASQEELGQLLGNLRQNAVSTRLSRTHYEELKDLNELYQEKLMQLL